MKWKVCRFDNANITWVFCMSDIIKSPLYSYNWFLGNHFMVDDFKLRHVTSMTVWLWIWNIYETYHTKTGLDISVVVIPKEGLAGSGQSFFWYDTDCRIVLSWLQRLYYIVVCQGIQAKTVRQGGPGTPQYSRCHTKRRMGVAPPANPSFGMTTTKILRPVLVWHGLYETYPGNNAGPEWHVP